MAPKPRLALLPLLLALSASAGGHSAQRPAHSPIPSVNLPAGIKTPVLGALNLAPSVAAPLIPSPVTASAPASAIAAPQISGPMGLTAALGQQSTEIVKALDLDPSGQSAEKDIEALYAGQAVSPAGTTLDSISADILASERPAFSDTYLNRVRQIERALTTAVGEAARSTIGEPPVSVQSRGSTARLTFTDNKADYDLSVSLPVEWGPNKVKRFFRHGVKTFKRSLTLSASRAAALLFPNEEIRIVIDGPSPLSDRTTRSAVVGIGLIHLKFFSSKTGKILVDTDISLTNRKDYLSPYPEYFARQLQQVLTREGSAPAERLLSDIRLAKRLFKDAVGSYKSYHGGPSAVGIEQMVMQSGKVLDSDLGQTVLKTGSFEKMMDRIYEAAFDSDGRRRSVEEAHLAWTVHNPFMAPANFLSFVQKPVWTKLANIARQYRQARVAGDPINFKDLLRTYRPQAEPGALTLRMLEQFTLTGPRPGDRGREFLYAQGATLLPPGLEESWRVRSSKEPRRENGLRTHRALLLRRGDRIFVIVPVESKGAKALKPVHVDENLAQGVISDTLVEVDYDKSGVRALRPVGAYPLDMMVGRVTKRQGKLWLEGLFRQEGRSTSLYEPLPLAGTVETKESAIVQAFIQPSPHGFEAVPLMDLGREITPEIAAREIALRHGARGYIEESVIRQAEDLGRRQDPLAEFSRLTERMLANTQGPPADLRSLPFVTIDPVGAGDLDDAYFIEKNPDGGFTWYLATADVARYVQPGSPAFRAAARVGNTFYSIDKDGVPEYPMNHPVVSKSMASLLSGKDSLAMITRMRFGADGRFLLEDSGISLGLIHVQGRYTYEQVSALWKGRPDHRIEHIEQVTLARELATKLHQQDRVRGKLDLEFEETAHYKRGGQWGTEKVDKDPLLSESHRLIEELKVYGNRVIAARLDRISQENDIPHISRIHPAQDEEFNERLRKQLLSLGVPWETGSVWEYVTALRARQDLSPELKDTAQMLVLTSRRSAEYAADDADGHEGLALEPNRYDHPSAPIRRFSDMYNRALLEASLEGADPKQVHAAVLSDLKAMGFGGFREYLKHLNGREQATRQMDREVDDFMSIFELAKPENKDKIFRGYVKMRRDGREPTAVIQLNAPPVTVTLRGEEALSLQLLDAVDVKVLGADVSEWSVRTIIRKLPKASSNP